MFTSISNIKIMFKKPKVYEFCVIYNVMSMMLLRPNALIERSIKILCTKDQNTNLEVFF